MFSFGAKIPFPKSLTPPPNPISTKKAPSLEDALFLAGTAEQSHALRKAELFENLSVFNAFLQRETFVSRPLHVLAQPCPNKKATSPEDALFFGGDGRARTGDLLRDRQSL